MKHYNYTPKININSQTQILIVLVITMAIVLPQFSYKIKCINKQEKTIISEITQIAKDNNMTQAIVYDLRGNPIKVWTKKQEK